MKELKLTKEQVTISDADVFAGTIQYLIDEGYVKNDGKDIYYDVYEINNVGQFHSYKATIDNENGEQIASVIVEFVDSEEYDDVDVRIK